MLKRPVTSPRPCTVPGTIRNKMAEREDELFVFGEDLDAILDILEEDDLVEKEFSDAVVNAQSNEIVCECGKKYKTRGGYERHIASKHNGTGASEGQAKETFSSSCLAEIVQNALQMVVKPVFAANLRKELGSYKFQQLEEGSEEYITLKGMYERLSKNGNVDRFYSDFYANVPLHSTTYFIGLSRNAATLLATKVADCMVANCKKQKSSSVNTNSDGTLNQKVEPSEKEIAGLQYLGGYVLQNLHRKHSKFDSSESQQAMLILKAGKKDEMSNDKQKLISSLNRGGLWLITEPVEKIFRRTEHHFRLLTQTGVQRIDFAIITNKSTRDSTVISNYNLIVTEADCKPDVHVMKDVLHSIICLYVRVRSFSFARDVIQRYKFRTKQGKRKALRKEISKSCEDKDRQH